MTQNRLLYGIAQLKKDGEAWGWIAKGSFNLNGVKATYADIEAEQVPGAPVKVLQQANAKVNPTFDLIDLSYESLRRSLGGELITSGEGESLKTVGWRAPAELTDIVGKFEIVSRSGQIIEVGRAQLLANLTGLMALTETAKINCELRQIAPEEDVASPYGIYDEGYTPASGSQQVAPIKEGESAEEQPVAAIDDESTAEAEVSLGEERQY